MFDFFIISLSTFIVLKYIGKNNEEKTYSNECNNYPSGYELKNQLRKTIIYDYDITNLNYDLIEEYIFRDYVYNFEINSGYSRDVALRKALDKYIGVYNILDKKYKY